MKADDTMYVPLEPDNVRKIRKRHRIIRVIIPISFVVVIIAALLTIAYQSYYANRKAALVLSNDLLKALEQRISIEVQAYLKPAVHGYWSPIWSGAKPFKQPGRARLNLWLWRCSRHIHSWPCSILQI